ncbi:Maf family protein [Salinisphaera orenii]|uniref:7-methyl-GTP pyrophosphatase n=1 Tax=Salinisphaera orenii YIM 95161 TaxID=1051139 RepID=A0A423Q7X2_9GAMM|nr:nucleoside triphosphate pyrophosphatase [Salinisphaera halophila]ROO36326.1 septum formation protein Maf [Salinisphaera halophila YIM 95161]
MAKDHPLLILASSSPWRRQLLRQLGVRFEATAPEVDETALPGEPPIDLARRLARAKAERVASMWPEAIVIGSDQVADVNGTILGKPGSRDRAIEQLQQQSGQTVYFHTGLCVCAPGLDTPLLTVETVTTTFRELGDDEIRRYVAAEDVTATAGSIKSEGLGIALVESLQSRDPSTLVGLPLIALRHFLARVGIAVP